VKEFLNAYRGKMKSISDRIDSLNAEKSSLKRELFNS
jgi:hypothetical protein